MPPGTIYAEPCAGAGDLVQLLAGVGLECDWGLELEPQGACLRNRWPIGQGNAMRLQRADLGRATMFISNPPWTRPILHALIEHLAAIAPAWFLFDASWPHTQQAAELGAICTDVVSVGRLKWFDGSEHDATDDCAWYRFDAVDPRPTRFHWRTVAPAAQGRLAL